MYYTSTRGAPTRLNFADALLAGLATDGGLYMPESWPQFSSAEIASFAGKPYGEVAAKVLKAFAGTAIPDAVIEEICKKAYARFDHNAVTPLTQIAPNQFILELFHGPTLAFKDVAMQMLGHLMEYVLEKRDQKLTIVGATSGDTGGAAIEAFAGSKRVNVFFLYPEGRVSDVQRRMMTTPTSKNIETLALEGTFDDAQNIVKAMFAHETFRKEVSLSAVNSINWARIVAQVTYYFVAAVALGAPHRKVSFIVPSGNFGNIFAGYVASKMGLPVERFTIATNSNDILARTIKTGEYTPRGVVPTSAPSMDIQISSNFERLIYDMSGRDSALVTRLMQNLKQQGEFTLPPDLLQKMQALFSAGSASEAEITNTIHQLQRECGYLTEPHTATAVHVAKTAENAAPAAPQIILSTAHPAKFAESMSKITGKAVALPARFKTLLSDKERFTLLPNDQNIVERHIMNRVRVL